MIKEISFNSFPMKLPTNYSLTNHMDIHLNVDKEVTDVKLLNVHGPVHWPRDESVRQSPWRLGFNFRSSHAKDSKNGTDTSLLNTQNYKVLINGKGDQSIERSSTLSYHSM